MDVEEGNLIFVRGGAKPEGECIETSSDVEQGRLFRAVKPGIGRLEATTSWSAFVRVSRREYVGRSLYRHWEEVGMDKTLTIEEKNLSVAWAKALSA